MIETDDDLKIEDLLRPKLIFLCAVGGVEEDKTFELVETILEFQRSSDVDKLGLDTKELFMAIHIRMNALNLGGWKALKRIFPYVLHEFVSKHINGLYQELYLKFEENIINLKL